MATYDLTTTTPTKIVKGDILNCPYSGTYKTITLPKGTYQLECWGAQGGTGAVRAMVSSGTTTYTALTTSTISNYFTIANGSSYYFAGSDSTWTSNNQGVASSSATTTLTATQAISGKITYSYSSETNYDKFTMVVGGTTVLNAVSGATTTGTYEFSLTSGQTISFTYSKDGSVNSNDDQCTFQISYATTTTGSYTPATSITASYAGGKGGYSKGTITLKKEQTIYLYTGGQGLSNINSTSKTTINGGFNGGGKGSNSYYTSGTPSFTHAGSGGGASDIRIGSTSLYSRVIVAGGGGGAAGSSDSSKYGGGTSGGSGSGSYHGTQTSAGTNGSFGQGADQTTTNYNYIPGGGGGGWYGGGKGNSSDSSSSYRAYNGGGSGWVYTASTFSAWQSGNSTDAANWTLDENSYLTDASTVAGSTSFASTSGSTETGHSGNGYVRITVIDVQSLNVKVKINSTWKQADNIYIKVNGTWNQVTGLKSRVSSSWKE